MDQELIFYTLLGMMVVTYIPRFFPLLFLSGRSLSPFFVSWLKMVPPAVLSAMLFPTLLIRDKQFSIGFDNIYLVGALVAFPVAWKTRSLFGAVFAGMATVALCRYFGLGG